MAKLMNIISDSLKERVEMVVRRPKRRRMKSQIVASTEDRKRKILGEIKALDKRAIERGEMQERLVPVLFLWGEPRKILHSNEVQSWENLGMKITYLKESEVKILKIKH